MTTDEPTPDSTPDATTEAEDSGPNAYQYQFPDEVLQTLVDVINETGLMISATLTVGGSVIEGQLCGGQAFFDQLTNQLKQAVGPGAAHGTALTALAQSESDAYAQTDWSDEGRWPAFHVHMLEATVNGSHRLPSWRGRLVDIDGWTLGSSGR